MSYLEFPRLVFSGRFQADVSTVNNDVRHYDNGTWEDRFQEMQSSQAMNGWRNPDGTGDSRLHQAALTDVITPEGAAAGDPLLGARIEDNVDLPPAKLVDLDPQFQMASMIWGLQLSIRDDQGEFLRADYEPAPFRDLFFGRVAGVGGSGGAPAKFTSRLRDLRWGERASSSPFLARLREVAEESGFLSANLMTYGYDTRTGNATYTLGRMLGVIGPWHSAEPKSFSAGRRFAPAPANSPFATAEDNIGFFDAHIADGHIHLDLANALPLQYRAVGARVRTH